MANGNGTGIVLNGTAPAMTLMSGAMIAFAEQGVQFDTISATGAGGLVGMLYLAPKGGKKPVDALRELPNLFVSDWLYRLFPVNFKVFQKYGPFAEHFWELRKRLPQIYVAPEERSEVKRFINDWIQLWATVLTPPSFRTARKGLMSHVPLIADLVDFVKLKAQPTKFYINTFSLRTRRLRIFDEQEMDADIFNAAQAMYMLFEPVRTANDLLITGATRDPTGLQAIWTRRPGLAGKPALARVLALDPVSDAFWRMPENAYDAFQLMLMNPIAALQELMLNFYGWTEWEVNRVRTGGLPPLYRIPVEINEQYYPRMLEWTHANAVKLQEIGREAAMPIAKLLRGAPSSTISGASDGEFERYRYKNALDTTEPRAERAQQCRTLYQTMFANMARFMPAEHRPKSPEEHRPKSPEQRPDSKEAKP